LFRIHVLQVYKVQHKSRKNLVRGHNLIGAKELECAEKWCTGLSGVPPDSVRCTRTVQLEPATLENFRARSTIIHRTVRCATKLSDEPAEQRLPACQRSPARMNSASQKSERRSQRAPDCPVQQDDIGSNGRPALNPNGCDDVARTGQCTVTVRWRTGLSGAPIASRNQPTTRSGWEAINTSQPPHSLSSKHF
jgi:hypothetical protein